MSLNYGAELHQQRLQVSRLTRILNSMAEFRLCVSRLTHTFAVTCGDKILAQRPVLIEALEEAIDIKEDERKAKRCPDCKHVHRRTSVCFIEYTDNYGMLHSCLCARKL